MNPFRSVQKQVSIFVTAGFPEPDSLLQILPQLQEAGVNFVEVGIPFSDPMADGPVIQSCSTTALDNGMTLNELFRQLTVIRPDVSIPLVLMGYLNPVMQFGMDRFLANCATLNIASVILPDMSLELYERFYRTAFEHHGIQVTFLITPSTADERIRHIAEICSGSFVYLVGKNGITGEGYTIGKQQQERYATIRKICGDTPLFMGFGINSPAKKQQAFRHCDGAIIGTAYLQALANGTDDAFLKIVI